MSNYLQDSLESIGLEPSDSIIMQLNKYYEMLVEKNKVMNLTAITEYEEVVIKHFIDSILISKVFDMDKINSIIDVGTGAGFPGVVLKIFYPEKKITLLDSLNKRINFLKEVGDELGLSKLNCQHGRAEDFARLPKEREGYDLCVSRAVANLSTLLEYCLPFVKKGGYFVAYKAEDCKDEINAASNAVKQLGGVIEETIFYNIPNTDITRAFVIIKKVNNTNKKYPRKAGLPSKEPLK